MARQQARVTCKRGRHSVRRFVAGYAGRRLAPRIGRQTNADSIGERQAEEWQVIELIESFISLATAKKNSSDFTTNDNYSAPSFLQLFYVAINKELL